MIVADFRYYMSNVIELQHIKRNFIVGDETVHALRGVSFAIEQGSLSPSWVRRVLVNRPYSTS